MMVHYALFIKKLGPLNGGWMFGDERRNKVVKDMTQNRKYCEDSIARVHTERAAVKDTMRCPRPVCFETCVTGRSKPCVNLELRATIDLAAFFERECGGVETDMSLCHVYKHETICGVRFTSGEPV